MSERIENLEKSFIKLEGTMNNLSEKMSEVARSISTMSDAVSKLAMYDVKIERMEKDITNIASNFRTMDKRILELSDEHHNICDSKWVEADHKGIQRFIVGISFILGVITFVFGYLYMDISSIEEKQHSTNESLQEIKISIQALNGRFDLVDERQKKAGTQMYYIEKKVEQNAIKKRK